MQSPSAAISPAGPVFSRVVAGMWRMADWGLPVQERVRLIEQCLELGVTTFDHADIYGGYTVEALFGEALAASPALKQRLQIVTKCGIVLPGVVDGVPRIKQYNTSAVHITHSVEQSLRKLGVEHLDTVLIHRPSPLMDFDAMARTFDTLQAAGKVRHFGVSNFSAAQFDALHKRHPLVTNQIELSPLHLQPLDDGTLDGLQDHSVSPMVWSALGGGRLFTGDAPQAVRVRQVAAAIGEELGLSTAGAVYAWIMRLPCKPLPLTGSGRITAIREAVAACHVTMEPAQWFALLEAARGNEVP